MLLQMWLWLGNGKYSTLFYCIVEYLPTSRRNGRTMFAPTHKNNVSVCIVGDGVLDVPLDGVLDVPLDGVLYVPLLVSRLSCVTRTLSANKKRNPRRSASSFDSNILNSGIRLVAVLSCADLDSRTHC